MSQFTLLRPASKIVVLILVARHIHVDSLYLMLLVLLLLPHWHYFIKLLDTASTRIVRHKLLSALS